MRSSNYDSIKGNSFSAIVFLLVILFSSCGDDRSTLFTELSSSKTNIDFKNLLRESEDFNVLTFGYFYNGGGVAVGDINNDGLEDIYFTGNMMASHLYLNKGNFEFEEIATSAGVRAEGLWNTGVTMVDVNADGWLDIYVCRSAAALGIRRKNQLFINNRNLTFTESASIYGLDDQGYSTQAAFLDYDRDGDLDMYLLNHSVQEYAGFSRNLSELKNRKNKEYGDRLYQNNLFLEGGEMIGRFHDVTDAAGIQSTVLGFGLGVAVADVNGDAWPDIYVSNDYNEEDYLYINQQDGTFENEVTSRLDQSSLFSMGSDIADMNGDGLPDIVSLDMLPSDHQRIQMTSGSDNYAKKQALYASGFHLQSMRNMLHINNGDGTFSEVGQLSGISNTDWSWACLIEDYDLDGRNDLFVTNGYKADYTNMDFMAYAADQQIKSQKERKHVAVSDLIAKIPSIDVSNFLFKNQGDLKFEDVAQTWGLDKVSLSNGASYADLDNDGDLDLIVNNINEQASIYRNNTVESGQSKAVRVELKGPIKNPRSTGAKFTLLDDAGQIKFTKTLSPSRGFQSSVSPRIVIADTLYNQASTYIVLWSTGHIQAGPLEKEKVFLSIQYDSTAGTKSILTDPTHQLLLKEKKLIGHMHTDESYNDFDKQRLMPFMMSDRGGRMTKADVNSDGLDDLYFCGSSGTSGKLYIQTKTGSYKILNQSVFESHKADDEMDAIFVDVDRDSDKDLLVASSSYRSGKGDGAKLFLNNGSGKFELSKNGFPKDGNYSTVASDDFDQDGDMDIFLGGYINQSAFPTGGQSKLLMNDGIGNFRLKPSSSMDSILLGHIVTDATVTDYDQDGNQDLIIVGHWMSITICYSKKGEFECEQIDHTSGLWNTVEATDLNNDTRPDLLAGNYGLNSQLSANIDDPLTIFYSDFDGNGSIDPILCKSIAGKEYPFSFRDDMVAQIPEIKKKVETYEDYAVSTIENLLDQNVLDKAAQKVVNRLSTTVILNRRNGQEELLELPWQAQQSPVYAICVADIDGDTKKDIILGGNQKRAMVQLGPNLSNKGTILFGQDDGSFSCEDRGGASLGIKGEVRDIMQLPDNNFMFSRFQDSLLILSILHR